VVSPYKLIFNFLIFVVNYFLPRLAEPIGFCRAVLYQCLAAMPPPRRTRAPRPPLKGYRFL
jgi:hypothetical protein